MKFTITIDTDNAAFDDGERGSETARILRAIASRRTGRCKWVCSEDAY